MPRRPRAPEGRSRAGGPPTIGEAAAQVLAVAGPWLATAAVAAVGAAVPLPFDLLGAPLAMIVLVAVQFGGVAVSREMDLPRARRAWWMALACTAMLAPVLALQASTARTPFVSFANGAAGPLLWLTLGTLILLAVMLGWTASVSAAEPSRAPLLWAPAALLVPAMLRAGGSDIGGRAGLAAIAIAFGIGALVVAVGEATPHGARMPLVAAALVVELVALLVFGRGPGPVPGQGRIVAALATLLVLAAVVSIVAAPLAALVGRRFAETAAAPPAAPASRGSGEGPRRERRISRRSVPPSGR